MIVPFAAYFAETIDLDVNDLAFSFDPTTVPAWINVSGGDGRLVGMADYVPMTHNLLITGTDKYGLTAVLTITIIVELEVDLTLNV